MWTHQLLLRLLRSVMFGIAAMSMPLKADETNEPPEIRILYPDKDSPLFSTAYVRVTTEAFDPDGAIAEVRLYLDEALIDTVTNAPYNFVARVTSHSKTFIAVARDNEGEETVSAAVRIVVDLAPRTAVMVLQPEHSTVVPAGADLALKADLVATISRSITSEINFYLNGEFVGAGHTEYFTATNPPVTIFVRNLSEGEHIISVDLTEGICACPTHTIRAVNLAMRDPILTPDRELDFEVITAFPGSPTVIEYSTDFDNWLQLQTIIPETNYFRFTAPIEPGTSHRWYRASIIENP